jgi:predicted GIY-YIG superfamily endonuclease
MAVSSGMSKSDAIRLERYIKRKPAGEKVAVLKQRA